MAKGSPLNDKQRRFVAEYHVDHNATQAAIRAGYSAKTAKQIGARLLTNVDVASALAEREERTAKKLEITVERLTEMLIEDRELARKMEQPSAAVSAVTALAKLHGLIIDRKEVRQAPRRSPSEYTNEELIAIMEAGLEEGGQAHLIHGNVPDTRN
jgi:phage terminase small subunit